MNLQLRLENTCTWHFARVHAYIVLHLFVKVYNRLCIRVVTCLLTDGVLESAMVNTRLIDHSMATLAPGLQAMPSWEDMPCLGVAVSGRTPHAVLGNPWGRPSNGVHEAIVMTTIGPLVSLQLVGL